MAQYPEPLEALIRELGRLPGIGRKTAERLAFYILKQDEESAEQLAGAIAAAKTRIRECRICYNYSEDEVCPLCADPGRDRATICVVSQPQELWKIERTNEYHGLYHVLGGLISPVEGVAPEDLHIAALEERLKSGEVKEVILALDPKVEGEATAMFLVRRIRPLGIRVTRIALGIPLGRDLELADELTLSQALRGRSEL
ncbi:MAG: recombination mediator RecR [Candidatus Acetothermia bacterium]|jgi:recombination protein RecR|nr:recombination mediator RecR [Candidatus Acetothermia bacterium]MDH7504785.1 recombination mediator RecR [Candidatus Acetothermia bacterium]